MKIGPITILFASLSVFPSRAATFLFDQQSATGGVAGYGAPFQLEQPAGQAFTPSLNLIDFVQFQFIDSAPGDGLGAAVSVNLWSGIATNGTLLSTTPAISLTDSFHGTATFLFPESVSLVPGQTYFLQPVLNSGSDAMDICGDHYDYSGGTFYGYGHPNSSGLNLWFREGSVIPEPSVGALLLTGLVGLLARRRMSN